MTVSNPATAYNVYLGTKLIDTVFQSGKSDADEVRRSLIDHDGYDHRIRVVKARRHNPLSEDGMTVSNPKRPSYKMVGVAKPRSRSGGTAQKAGLAKGQSLMARAAAAYRAGEYASMQDALRGVARKSNPAIPVGWLNPTPPPPPPKKTLRGAPVENPRRKGSKSKAKRSSGRTVAQSNAAHAMKLFHSGQASSLAEAWDIIRSGR